MIIDALCSIGINFVVFCNVIFGFCVCLVVLYALFNFLFASMQDFGQTIVFSLYSLQTYATFCLESLRKLGIFVPFSFKRSIFPGKGKSNLCAMKKKGSRFFLFGSLGQHLVNWQLPALVLSYTNNGQVAESLYSSTLFGIAYSWSWHDWHKGSARDYKMGHDCGDVWGVLVYVRAMQCAKRCETEGGVFRKHLGRGEILKVVTEKNCLNIDLFHKYAPVKYPPNPIQSNQALWRPQDCVHLPVTDGFLNSKGKWPQLKHYLTITGDCL